MYARSCASRVFSSLNAFSAKSLFTNSTAATDIRLIMNAGMEENYPTYSELLKDVAQKMGIDRQYSPLQKNRSHLLKFLPKSQDELPKRSMNDSYTAAVISLSQDQRLQDKYTTFLGQVRVGRLLENMDMFAVFVAYKHISNPKVQSPEDFPYVFVTAMVDKIDFTDFIPKPQEDIKISGHVSWVGKSSMEIVIWLEQKMHDVWHKITRALFVFAARDANNEGPAIINAIEPANEREKQILSGGHMRQKNRFALMKLHLSKVVPDKDEQQLIHNLYLRTRESTDISFRKRLLPPGCVWMSTATISNVIFSHPEQRNLHNTIFGGYIMRQAEELSWVLSYMFSKYRPVLKSISDIHFQRPILVNSLIQMHANVVYTKLNYIQVTTYVETFNPVSGKNDTTNTMHFTFQVPEIVNEVVPNTYDEAMMYIDGKRHFENVMQKTTGNFPHKL